MLVVEANIFNSELEINPFPKFSIWFLKVYFENDRFIEKSRCLGIITPRRKLKANRSAPGLSAWVKIMLVAPSEDLPLRGTT